MYFFLHFGTQVLRFIMYVDPLHLVIHADSIYYSVYGGLSITQDGDTALILASGRCETEAVVELIKAGANLNLLNNVCLCSVSSDSSQVIVLM